MIGGAGKNIESRIQSKSKGIVLFIDKSLCSFEILNFMNLAIRNYSLRINSLTQADSVTERMHLALEYKKPKLFFERESIIGFCLYFFNYIQIEYATIKRWSIGLMEKIYIFIIPILHANLQSVAKSYVKNQDEPLMEGRDKKVRVVEEIKEIEEDIVDKKKESIELIECKSDMKLVFSEEQMPKSDLVQIEEQNNPSDKKFGALHKEIDGIKESLVIEESVTKNVAQEDNLEEFSIEFCEPDETIFQESECIRISDLILNTEIDPEKSHLSLINHDKHDRAQSEEQLGDALMSKTPAEGQDAKKFFVEKVNISAYESFSAISETLYENHVSDTEQEACILKELYHEDSIVNCEVLDKFFLIVSSKPLVVAESIEKTVALNDKDDFESEFLEKRADKVILDKDESLVSLEKQLHEEVKASEEAKSTFNKSFEAVKQLEKEIDINKRIIEDLNEVKRQRNIMIQEMKLLSSENKKILSQKHLIYLNKSVNEEALSRRNLITITENINRRRMLTFKNKILEDHQEDREKTIRKYINSTEKLNYNLLGKGSSSLATKPIVGIQKSSPPKVSKFKFPTSSVLDTMQNDSQSKINSKYISPGFGELNSRNTQNVGSLSYNESIFKYLPSNKQSANFDGLKPIKQENATVFTVVKNYHADAASLRLAQNGPRFYHLVLVGLLLVLYLLI